MIIRQWYCQHERNDLPSARAKARELDCTNSERSGVDWTIANPSMPVASWASHQRIPGYRMWRPHADHSPNGLDEAHGPCLKLRYRIPPDTHEQDFVKCCLRRFFEDKTLLQDESEGARERSESTGLAVTQPRASSVSVCTLQTCSRRPPRGNSDGKMMTGTIASNRRNLRV